MQARVASRAPVGSLLGQWEIENLEAARQIVEEGARALAAERPFRQALQLALEGYLEGGCDAAAMGRFATKVTRALDEADWPASYGGKRQKIVGAYFEAALKSRRRAGRPSTDRKGLFQHLAHLINLQRLAAGKAPYSRPPAEAIARLCSKQGWGDYSADTVRKALKKPETNT